MPEILPIPVSRWWSPEHNINAPLTWRKSWNVSMSDLFHKDVPDEFIARVFVVMAATPQHTYQVLTKRHARMRSLLRSERFQEMAGSAAFDWIQMRKRPVGWSWPPPNVWLGVSVEDQQRADLRLPALRATPAAVRFISAEPLLGHVDVASYLSDSCISWVIAGGESGPGARPMHPDWARSLRDQCQAAGVPYFFKQWGEWCPSGAVGIGSVDPSRSIVVGPPMGEHGVGRELVRVGKKAAGRELDGRTWDEFPASAR